MEGDDSGEAEEGRGRDGGPLAEEAARRVSREPRRGRPEERLDVEDRVERAAGRREDRAEEPGVEGRDEERPGNGAEEEVAARDLPREGDVGPRVEPVGGLKERVIPERRDDEEPGAEDEERRDEERQVATRAHRPGC